MQDEQQELLAAYAHETWAGWLRYMFSKGTIQEVNKVEGGIGVVWTMPTKMYERWQRQMNTSYADLPESEKASDRDEADKIRRLLGLVI